MYLSPAPQGTGPAAPLSSPARTRPRPPWGPRPHSAGHSPHWDRWRTPGGDKQGSVGKRVVVETQHVTETTIYFFPSTWGGRPAGSQVGNRPFWKPSLDYNVF